MPALPQRWTRFSARVPMDAAETLGARCIELGAPGVVVDERNLRRGPLTEPSLRPKRSLPARFTAYFPPAIDPLWLEAHLRASLDALVADTPRSRRPSFRLEPFRPPSYEASWRRHFPPIRCGRRLLIAPSWSTRRALAAAQGPGRILLRVDPARAFGTGHHPTTRGCLVALERVCGATAPRRGLDVGSGSGILGAAMRALGVSDVIAVDTDPVAREATASCARANGYGDVRVLESLAGVRGGFDVVSANLFAGLLIEMAPRLAARLRPGGRLIASGLLATQEEEVGRALRDVGLRLERRESRSTWTTLTLLRPNGTPPAIRARRPGARRSS